MLKRQAIAVPCHSWGKLRYDLSPWLSTVNIQLPGAAAHWVHPRLACEVEFSAWTRNHHLRHPSFKGLRMDKEPQTILREEIERNGKEKRGGPRNARASR